MLRYSVLFIYGIHVYAISQVTFTSAIFEVADPSSRPVYDVDLRLLACWDCGFESRPRAWVSVSCGMLCVGR